jgi:hypothetical protein
MVKKSRQKYGKISRRKRVVEKNSLPPPHKTRILKEQPFKILAYNFHASPCGWQCRMDELYSGGFSSFQGISVTNSTVWRAELS